MNSPNVAYIETDVSIQRESGDLTSGTISLAMTSYDKEALGAVLSQQFNGSDATGPIAIVHAAIPRYLRVPATGPVQ